MAPAVCLESSAAAFADKDFKLLAAEYNADEDPGAEPSAPSEDSPGEPNSENSEA